MTARNSQGDHFKHQGSDEIVWSNDDFYAVFRPSSEQSEPRIVLVQTNSDSILIELDQSFDDFSTPEEAIEVALDYLHSQNLLLE